MSDELLRWVEILLRWIGIWPNDRIKTMRRRRRRWKRRARIHVLAAEADEIARRILAQ